jgi:hypothetical protein
MTEALLLIQFSPPFEVATVPLRTILPGELGSESIHHNLS